MSVPYDVFAEAFLSKIQEYNFVDMKQVYREETVDGYLRRAVAEFKWICKYDLTGAADNQHREFNIDIDDSDLDELVDIISEGMIVHWLKPYLNHQDNLQSVLNTKDFTTYSRAELLYRIGNAHTDARKHFVRLMRHYSYNHGDLTDLHT